ncbi:MAG: GAF domain-containing protein [Actinobacteria bacterium]|nr:GAF domain-containing protein [Actinomycetota bacterium]
MTDEQATVIELSGGGYPTSRIAPKLRPVPSIEAIERRRGHLWAVAGLLLLAFALAIILLFLGEDPAALLPDAPARRWSFLALAIAFILYVVDQERRLRKLTTALIDERVLTASLQARIADLATLTKVGRVVNSVLTLEEVLETIVTSAFELTGANNGSVMLRDGEVLRVAASAGSSPAPVGTTLPFGSGVAGWVAERGRPLLINGRLGDDQFPGSKHKVRSGSSLVAPMVAAHELLGVLAVERPPDAEPFTETQLRSVALFAEHAATAVSNAYRYGEERDTVQELADVLERRSEFVATMVHELKTPLTVIIGFASVLERKWDELGHERRLDAISAIRGQSDRLRNMVDEVLRTASAEARADPRREAVNLGQLLTGLIDTTATLAQERDGQDRLVRLAGAEQGATVRGDPQALYRVFENLLENAVKYSPAGSPVEVQLERDSDAVTVHITDQGPGIPPEELETIFERFRQTGYTVSGGVGLGLYIVRVLVRSHGGEVTVRSTVGDGTTFTVRLPVRLETDEDSDPADLDVPTAP